MERRIKKYLDDIADIAFSDSNEDERKKYKCYKLKLQTKELSSKNGHYKYNERLIEVFNVSRGTGAILKTCLHELSHHIDYMQHGISGHKAPFYNIYEKLIYASLDMGLLTKNDFNNIDGSSDSNKVRAIINRYIPHTVNYKKDDMVSIFVYNSYSIKDKLKENGYHWNKIEQVWEKNIEDNIEDEELYLNRINVVKGDKDSNIKTPYYVIKESNMYIEAIIYIGAVGNTYEKRDILKEYHFYFNRDNQMWCCKIKSNDKDTFLKKLNADERLKDCKFGIINRKK